MSRRKLTPSSIKKSLRVQSPLFDRLYRIGRLLRKLGGSHVSEMQALHRLGERYADEYERELLAEVERRAAERRARS